jgi:hypothetical protein
MVRILSFSVTPLVFFAFPAVPSALLALGFASSSHDATGKVIVTGHESEYRSPHENQKETLV